MLTAEVLHPTTALVVENYFRSHQERICGHVDTLFNAHVPGWGSIVEMFQ